jgi:hypothetical protein
MAIGRLDAWHFLGTLVARRQGRERQGRSDMPIALYFEADGLTPEQDSRVLVVRPFSF